MFNVIFEDEYGLSSGVGTAEGLSDLEKCLKFIQDNLTNKGLKGKVTVTTDDNHVAFTALVENAIEAQREYEEMLNNQKDYC